ncbi:MAG: DUF2079 domain-containing protein [Desulfobacterales bacterium]|nr:DUF2079 domain-containing protein [Desulfobacterales bacterium]
MRNENFWFSAYDVAKQDQSIWLLSRFEPPFNTIRGMNTFGDHAHFIYVLLCPLYWLLPSINLFLFLTPLIRGLSGLGIFFIAKEKLKGNLFGLFAVLLMLLNPAFGNVNLDHFYPETWATTFLIFAFFFSAVKTNWRWYYTLFLTALLMKEDVSLIFFMLSIYLFFFKKERKHAAITAIISAAYFILAAKLLSYFAGTYSVFASGGQMGGILSNAFNIKFYLAKATEPVFLDYVFKVGAPLLFIPLAAPHVLFISLPSIMANMLSGWPYLKTIDYHYTIYITPFLFIAFIYALSSLKKHLYAARAGKILFTVLLLLIFTATMIANLTGSKIPLPQVYHGTKADFLHYKTSRSVKEIHAALALIDDVSPVSADTFFAAHLAHRKKIYQFPVPWYPNYYGVSGTRLPETEKIKYVFVKHKFLQGREKDLVDRLISLKKYKVIFRGGEITLLEKNPAVTGKDDQKPHPPEMILYENFEGEYTRGRTQVWSGSLDSDRFSTEMFVKDNKETTGSSYELVSSNGMDAEFYFMVPVEPNQIYRFSGWIHNGNVININAGFWGKYFIQQLNRPGDYRFESVTSVTRMEKYNAGDNKGWYYQEAVFHTAHDTRQIRISASFASWGSAKGKLYIDNMKLENLD